MRRNTASAAAIFTGLVEPTATSIVTTHPFSCGRSLRVFCRKTTRAVSPGEVAASGDVTHHDRPTPAGDVEILRDTGGLSARHGNVQRLFVGMRVSLRP